MHLVLTRISNNELRCMRHRQMKIIKILSFFPNLRKKISFLRSIFATEIKNTIPDESNYAQHSPIQ